MDKFVEQDLLKRIKALVYDGDYEGAESLTHEVEVDRMKNPSGLCLIGEVYMNVGKLSEAESIFLRAYDKAPANRRILSLLTNLYIKKKEYNEADNYYKEFITVATRDVQRYILRYKIDSGKGEKLETLIGTLEKLKDYEYREEWAYELASLYAKAGETDKCIRECEEIALWFGNGEYVDKAAILRNRMLGIEPEIPQEPEVTKEPVSEEVSPVSEDTISDDKPAWVDAMEDEPEDAAIEETPMPAGGETVKNIYSNMDETVLDLELGGMLEEELSEGASEEMKEEPSEEPFEEMKEEPSEEFEEELDDFEDDFEDEIIDGPDEDDDLLLKALSSGDEEFVDEELKDEDLDDEDIEEEIYESVEEEPEINSEATENNIEEAAAEENLIQIEEEETLDEEVEEIILMEDEVASAFESVANIESLQNQLAKCFNPVVLGQPTDKNYLIRGNDDAVKTYLSVAIPKFLDKYDICSKTKVVRITAADINGKNFAIMFDGLKGGCLLIKNAHKLDQESVKIICDHVYSGVQETVIILDSEEAEGFWEENVELKGAFAQQIRIKAFSSLDLLGIAKSCVEENGYELSFEASVTLKEHFDMMLKNNITIDFEDIFDLVSQAIGQLDERNIKKLLNPENIRGRFTDNWITLDSEDFLNVLQV